MPKYAAQLLFIFRVAHPDYTPEQGGFCETRIINFNAESDVQALDHANDKGKQKEYDYLNDEGNQVFFEYKGIIDIKCLDNLTESDEVWYEVLESNNFTNTVQKMLLTPDRYELFRK